MKKEIVIKQVISIMLTVISTIIAFLVCEPIAFTQMNLTDKLHNKLFIIIAISFIITMYLVWNLIIVLITKLKNKDETVGKFVKHFLIYFIIMIIFLMIIWPGHFVWDEIHVIKYTQEYTIFMWQSVITQIYYAIALLIYPSIISIVVLQILIISSVVAFIQTKIEMCYRNKWFNIIIYLLFLLPAIMINNLYILRLPIYSYIILLFFAILLFDSKEKKNLRGWKIIVLYILSSFIVLWRSEGIIFLLFIPILMALTYKELRKPIKMIAICVVLVGTYVTFNKIFESNQDKNYSLLIYANPLSNMLQEELEVKQEELEAIDKVMNIEVLKDNPSYSETPSYWSGNLIREDFELHLKEMQVSYIKIVLRNTISFLKTKFATFFASSGLDKETPQGTNQFLYHVNENPVNDFINEFQQIHTETKPLCKDLKVAVESFLMGENLEKQTQNRFITIVFWNFIPMIMAIVVIGIVNIKNKQWLIVGICVSLLAKVGIVFLTAPASYFMYYLPEYITGLLLTSIVIFEKIKQRREDKIKNDRFIKEK